MYNAEKDKEFAIRQFIKAELPTNFTRRLTDKERGVIYRLLSMLYSNDHVLNGLVRGDVVSTIQVLWLHVHHREYENVQSYQESINIVATLSEVERSQITEFQQFMKDCYGAADASKPLTLFEWVDVISRDPDSIQRWSRWQDLGMTMQEIHCAYFEYMLEEC